MNIKTKKKLRTIALAILILLLPLGYMIVLSIAIDSQNRDLLNVMQTNYHIKPLVRKSIASTERAIFWKPWDSNLRQNRLMLLLQIQDYNQALVAIQDDIKVSQSGVNYGGEGLVYEYLGDTVMAVSSYKKAIELYQEDLKENPKDDYLLAEIATLFMIVGDTNQVRSLLNRRKSSENTVSQGMINRQNELILSYKSGGLSWFVEYAKEHY